MKLNEDNTITLSFRETQKFITKVINPEYKQLERYRKRDALKHQYNNVESQFNVIKQKQSEIIKIAKDSRNILPRSLIASLDRNFATLIWMIEGVTDTSSEEVREIEAAYQLYKMLLKNRRFKEEDEQAPSLSEMPEQ
jgi:ABC-type transporter MlaC component